MNGSGSPSSFVKTEPDSNSESMTGFNNFGQGSWPGSAPNINNNSNMFPSNGSMMRSNFGMQSNKPGTFEDDELAEFLDFDQTSNQMQSPQEQQFAQANTNHNRHSNMNAYAMSAPQRTQLNYMSNDIYSNTPPGNPVQSPFAQSYDPMSQANMVRLQQQSQAQFRNAQGGGFGGSQRMASSSLSPGMSQHTMASMQLGTSETSSHGQSIPNHRHRNSSSQWENRLSGLSFGSSPAEDTPLTSPLSVPPMQQHLASIMENDKTPPTTRSRLAVQKAQSVPGGASKEEQKKAKRRFAHNVVEQKRRDKINERIQELSRLLPAHRLEDNKILKQLASSSRTVSGGASGMSPPSNSTLRKSSSVSQATPADERDKTKGNSLDGAVAWTRDLMWMLHRKLEQESLLIETIESLGGQVPFQIREDEQRMRTELTMAIAASGTDCFEYSRSHGTGLWVPEHTDQAGNPLAQNTAPDYFVSYPGPPASNNAGHDSEQQWGGFTPESGRDSLDFKEPDAFDMDFNHTDMMNMN